MEDEKKDEQKDIPSELDAAKAEWAKERAELRKEAAGYRVRATELDGKLKGFEGLDPTKYKEATETLSALQTDLTRSQERALDAELRAAAATKGFRDPADAVRLLDRAALKVSKEGSPENAADLLAELAKAKPYLVQGAGGGSKDAAASGATATTDMNAVLRNFASGR